MYFMELFLWMIFLKMKLAIHSDFILVRWYGFLVQLATAWIGLELSIALCEDDRATPIDHTL